MKNSLLDFVHRSPGTSGDVARIAIEVHRAPDDARAPAIYASLEEYARQGDPLAMCVLGRLVSRGWGARDDPDRGLRWVELAANRGFAPALSDLAERYQHGLGVRRDLDRAVDLFRDSLKGGYGPAATSIARILLHEFSVPDIEQARHYLEQAFDLGDAAAAADLGELFESGVTGSVEIGSARHWYLRGAQAGDLSCLMRLESAYRHGQLGLVRSSQRADELLASIAAISHGAEAANED